MPSLLGNLKNNDLAREVSELRHYPIYNSSTPHLTERQLRNLPPTPREKFPVLSFFLKIVPYLKPKKAQSYTRLISDQNRTYTHFICPLAITSSIKIGYTVRIFTEFNFSFSEAFTGVTIKLVNTQDVSNAHT